MEKVIFLFLALLLLYSGCKENNPNAEKDLNIIQVDLEKKQIRTSAFLSSCNPVILETNENSLIQEISKSYLTKEYLIIKSNHSLLLFNRDNGKLIHVIDRVGNGPEDYTQLSDFDVDEKMEHIHILDKAKQKIITYNFQGEYQGSSPINIWAIKLIKKDPEQFYLYSGNETSEGNPYKLNVFNQSSIVESFFKIDDDKKNYLHINSAQNFYWKDGMAFFFEAFNDTIYSLEQKKPVYFIQYKHAVPSDFFNNRFANIMEFFQKYNQMGYTNSTYNVFESDNQFFFSCFDKGIKYFNVYNKEEKQCHSFNEIIDDLFFQDCMLPFSEDEFVFWTNRDNEIVYYLSPQFAREHAETIIKSENQEIINKVLEDDNPIAIICKLKE